MRQVLNTVSMEGRIVIGEGEKDEVCQCVLLCMLLLQQLVMLQVAQWTIMPAQR